MIPRRYVPGLRNPTWFGKPLDYLTLWELREALERAMFLIETMELNRRAMELRERECTTH